MTAGAVVAVLKALAWLIPTLVNWARDGSLKQGAMEEVLNALQLEQVRRVDAAKEARRRIDAEPDPRGVSGDPWDVSETNGSPGR